MFFQKQTNNCIHTSYAIAISDSQINYFSFSSVCVLLNYFCRVNFQFRTGGSLWIQFYCLYLRKYVFRSLLFRTHLARFVMSLRICASSLLNSRMWRYIQQLPGLLCFIEISLTRIQQSLSLACKLPQCSGFIQVLNSLSMLAQSSRNLSA